MDIRKGFDEADLKQSFELFKNNDNREETRRGSCSTSHVGEITVESLTHLYSTTSKGMSADDASKVINFIANSAKDEDSAAASTEIGTVQSLDFETYGDGLNAICEKLVESGKEEEMLREILDTARECLGDNKEIMIKLLGLPPDVTDEELALICNSMTHEQD